jgi:FkbM family methyltransferase
MPNPVSRLSQAFRNYRNPVGLWVSRLLKRPVIKLCDRRTGLTFRCRNGADSMMGETFHRRVYDVAMAPVRNGDVVLDVGANHGFTACYFAKKGARVYAFEPDPANARMLQENICANGLEDEIILTPCAVGGRNGTVKLFRTEAMGGGQTTTSQDFAERANLHVKEVLEVESQSIKHVLDVHGIQQVRLLKLDCEGAELEILQSLDEPLLRNVDSMAIEYHPEAYPVASLVKLILSWGNFHISLPPAARSGFGVIHAVRDAVIMEWFEIRSRRTSPHESAERDK